MLSWQFTAMAKAYKIETERLIIRCFQPTDVLLVKQAIDNSLTELKLWMPWANNEPENIEQKVDRLRKFRGLFDLDQDYCFGVFNKTETELIGSTGLHTRQGPDAREIGYWLQTKYTRQGFATETVSALIKTAFDIEGILRVEIHCDPRNERSLSIPRRLGFMHEATLGKRLKGPDGVIRDKMIWTLFKNDYEDSGLKRFPLKAFNAINEAISI